MSSISNNNSPSRAWPLTTLLPLVWVPALVFLLAGQKILLGIYLFPTALLYLLSSWAIFRRGELGPIAQLGLQVSPVWIFPSLVFGLVATARFPLLLPAYLCLLLPAAVHLWRPARIGLPAAISGSLFIGFLCNWFLAAPVVTTPQKVSFSLLSTGAVALCAMPIWTFAAYWHRLREAPAPQASGWLTGLPLTLLLLLFIGLGGGLFTYVLSQAFN